MDRDWSEIPRGELERFVKKIVQNGSAWKTQWGDGNGDMIDTFFPRK